MVLASAAVAGDSIFRTIIIIIDTDISCVGVYAFWHFGCSVEPFYFLYGAGFTFGFSRVIFPHRGFYLWLFSLGGVG